MAGIFAEFLVRSKFIVQGDAAATASNIIASETLYRLGLTHDLIMTICDVGVALVLYISLKPVHSGLASIATSFRLIKAAIPAINSLNHIAVLSFLSGADYLIAFTTNQLHAMIMMALKAHTFGYLVSGAFFGVDCFLLGCLLYKSVFFPDCWVFCW
jgi:hypothetical protein